MKTVFLYYTFYLRLRCILCKYCLVVFSDQFSTFNSNTCRKCLTQFCELIWIHNTDYINAQMAVTLNKFSKDRCLIGAKKKLLQVNTKSNRTNIYTKVHCYLVSLFILSIKIIPTYSQQRKYSNSMVISELL